MEDTRRGLLKKGISTFASTTAIAGCLEDGQSEDFRYLKLDTDLERAHSEVDGMEIYTNLNVYAEVDGDESLKEIGIQHLGPEDDVFEYLDNKEANGDEAQMIEPHHSDEEGIHEYRAYAVIGDKTHYSEKKFVRWE